MKDQKTARQEMKKLMADLAKTLQGHHSKPFSLRNPSANGIMEKAPLKRSPEDAAREAQELIYDAWESGRKSERIRLARRALVIFPDCADAYNLLATDAAKTPEEKIGYYEKGMEAARRTLGEKNFKEGKGHFWGILDTRPYMRSRAGLMQCLWDAGRHDEALHHARDMLKLNPNDNQGIRYILIAYLADAQLYERPEQIHEWRGLRKRLRDGLALYARLTVVCKKRQYTNIKAGTLRRNKNEYPCSEISDGKETHPPRIAGFRDMGR